MVRSTFLHSPDPKSFVFGGLYALSHLSVKLINFASEEPTRSSSTRYDRDVLIIFDVFSDSPGKDKSFRKLNF